MIGEAALWRYPAVWNMMIAGAHEPGEGAASGDGVGRVHFPVSCRAEVQAGFDRSVALLHSFRYKEALDGFSRVVGNDPDCAMG